MKQNLFDEMSLTKEEESISSSSYYYKEGVNSSSFKLFLKSPRLYDKMINSKELSFKDTGYTILGRAIHSAILESREEFLSKYVLSSTKIEGKMGDYIQHFVDSSIAGINDDAAHEIAYIKSGFLLTQQSIRTKFETDPDIRKYLKFLKLNVGKILFNKEDWNKIEECRNSVYSHKRAKELLENFDNLSLEREIFSEQEIYWNTLDLSEDVLEFDLKLKSKVDRIIVKEKKGSIILVDIKSTSYNPHTFCKKESFSDSANRPSIEDILRQQSFYNDALKVWSKKKYKKNFSIESYLIVVQTTSLYETVVYNLTPIVRLGKFGEKGYINILRDINWHKQKSKWGYPRSYYEGTGEMLLDETNTNLQ